MSGPKVVRIVTREEILAICHGHLAQLDAAIREWTRVGQRNDCVTEEEIAATQRRRDAIAKLLAREDFMGLQKQAPQEIGFLRSDMERRLAGVAAAAAEARSVERRQKQGAQALLAALRQAGAPVTPELERSLTKTNDPAAISQAWTLLGEQTGKMKDAQRASEQQTLAAKYGEGLERRSFADWAACQPALAPDPALAALDRKVAELQLIAPASAEAFERRLSELESNALPRRSLLLDSLNLDLSRALVEARARYRTAEELALVLAELAAVDAGKAAALQATTETAAPDAVSGLVDEARATLAAVRAENAAAQRRQTMLTNLAALGYEVTEGMSTAWVDNGRLTIRNAARPDYGVEIGGDMSNERVQMRVVAFADETTPQDTTRDRDAETLWCSDVDALKASLNETGGEILIERALAVGAAPVKRVADPAGNGHFRGQETKVEKSRTLN